MNKEWTQEYQKAGRSSTEYEFAKVYRVASQRISLCRTFSAVCQVFWLLLFKTVHCVILFFLAAKLFAWLTAIASKMLEEH